VVSLESSSPSAVFSHDDLRDSVQPDYDRVRVADATWGSIYDAHHDFGQAESQRRRGVMANRHLAASALRWEKSGLTGLFTTDSSELQVSVDSLAESVMSGRIRAITKQSEPAVQLLVDFLSKRQITVSPGYWRDSEIADFIAARKAQVEFLYTCFSEVKHQPYSGKYLKGPYRELFDHVTDQVEYTMAETFGSDIPLSILHPRGYYSDDAEEAAKRLGDHRADEVYALSRARTAAYTAIAETTWPEDHLQTIEQGLYSRPAYAAQRSVTMCANAAFRMVYQAVRGEQLSEEDLLEARRQSAGSIQMDDQDFLKLFQAPSFQRSSKHHVQSLQFGAMSLGKLAEISKSIKKRRPDADIFAVVGVQTEYGSTRSPFPKAQHRVVLLDADKELVRVLDPKFDRAGRKPRIIPKRTFTEQWAATQNTGYLVVAS
jgi:hypothetical protein